MIKKIKNLATKVLTGRSGFWIYEVLSFFPPALILFSPPAAAPYILATQVGMMIMLIISYLEAKRQKQALREMLAESERECLQLAESTLTLVEKLDERHYSRMD